MLLQCWSELRERTYDRGFRLFGIVGANRSDWGLVAFGHVRIRVPEPLDRPGALDERRCHFSFKEGSFVLWRAARDFVEVQFPLQAGFLNQHRFTRLLGGE